MEWDLGLGGLAYLAAMSLVFGVGAGLVVGGNRAHRMRAVVINALACFSVGIFVSEVMFGWATEEDLQPNIDGLSGDEVLLSSLLTTVCVVLVLRYRSRKIVAPKEPAHRA